MDAMSLFTRPPRGPAGSLPVAAVGRHRRRGPGRQHHDAPTPTAGLPPRTAAQLLADVQHGQRSSLSGTVVQTLGPRPARALPGRLGRPAASSSTDLARLRHAHAGGSGSTARTAAARPASAASASPTSSTTARTCGCGPARTSPPAPHAAADRRAPARRPAPGAPRPESRPLPSGAPHAGRGGCRGARRDRPDTTVTTSGTASVAGRAGVRAGPHPEGQDHPGRLGADRDRQPGARPAAGAGLLDQGGTNPAFEVGFTAVDFAKPGRSPVRVHPAARHDGHPVRRRDATAPTAAAPGRTAASSDAGRARRSADGRRHRAGARSSWPRSPSRPDAAARLARAPASGG